eukprot:GHVS01008060.1.p1 GENE.GHVS01008060.1~~GHVS01008060.1.p1  ORF type:complete len:158 (+),score=30.83 GHVS01008060.1:62-535(+)
MAMDPFCFLKAFGMCKEPPIEEVQPRWWDNYHHPPPPGLPQHRSTVPTPTAAAIPSSHHPPTSSTPPLSADRRRPLIPPNSSSDAVVYDSPTELRCFVPDHSMGRPYTSQADTFPVREQRMPPPNYTLSSKQKLSSRGSRSTQQPTAGFAQNHLVRR